MKLSLKPTLVQVKYRVSTADCYKSFGIISASSEADAIDKIRKSTQYVGELIAESTGELSISYIDYNNEKD
jgi:hypothetical protein